jgi:uncharacterized protein (UPF0303 family)
MLKEAKSSPGRAENMSGQADLDLIIEQEKRLAFSVFSEQDAFKIGSALKERADAQGAPIVIDISLWDRKLFYFARPGSTSDNEEWVRRKFNLVRRAHKSSYRFARELAVSGKTMAERSLSDADYAAAGGCFPIRLTNAGVIGAVTISGLPQRDDHTWVVSAIAAHLKLDISDIELPKE